MLSGPVSPDYYYVLKHFQLNKKDRNGDQSLLTFAVIKKSGESLLLTKGSHGLGANLREMKSAHQQQPRNRRNLGTILLLEEPLRCELCPLSQSNAVLISQPSVS